MDGTNSADNRKSNETKKNIIKIAVKLFREKGYDNITIKDICKNSDISKHTFYYYFKSKEDLLFAFRSLPGDIRMERFESIMNAKNFFEQYYMLTETLLDHFCVIGPEISKRILIMNIECKTDTFMDARHEAFIKIEIDIIKKAQDSGEIRNKSTPEELAYTAPKIVIGIVFFWSMSGGTHDLKKMVRNALEVMFDVEPKLRKEKTVVRKMVIIKD